METRVWSAAVFAALLLGSGAQAGENVVTYHNSLERHGDYTVPGLTLSAAANMHMDTSFHPKLSGQIYAQPLFWKTPSGKDELIAVTETNFVYAVDAKTGSVVWQTQVAKPVPLTDLPCGNINPIGITGTPVIDPQAGVVYFDALTRKAGSVRHLVYAVSLADGSVLSNWPIDVAASLKAQGKKFDTPVQGERSALLLFNGSLYVNYGGYFGDCGNYHGTVIQVQPSTQSIIGHWATRAVGGGIWAQGGLAGDGQSLYLTTGNTFSATQWSDGEAIIRLRPGLKHSTNTKDYFTPSNWLDLDNTDLDLGGTEALPIDIAVPNGPPAKRVIALGKDGNAYLADRANLGGAGGQVAVAQVSNQSIRTAAAVYSTSAATMLAFQNNGSSQCAGDSITMLNIAASGNSPITVAWCAPFNGGGAPIITTTDGASNPIVWVVGAEGDDVLHGLNALNGQVVFGGGNQTMLGLHHFQTIIAADRHFYIAADNTIYSFTF